MGAPYDNIPGIDSDDNFHPDIRAAIAASPELTALFAQKNELIGKAYGAYTYSTPATSYPVGISNFIAGPEGSWTFGNGQTYAQVVTYRAPTFVGGTTQWAYPYTDDTAPVTWRQWEYNASSWGPWHTIQTLIATGTTGQYYRGDKTWQTLNAAAVGLGSVNNTSDADKPVSTAQAAEDAKLAKGLVYKSLVATSTGTVVDAIINNIPTFTFKANRHYRIVWDFSHYASGNSDSLFYCHIAFCNVGDAAASLTGLTTIEGRTKGLITTYALGSTQYNGPISFPYAPGASDVTTQIKFRATRVLGDDGIIIVGNGNERAHYLIYDDGMQI
jgi:hypothetical protein